MRAKPPTTCRTARTCRRCWFAAALPPASSGARRERRHEGDRRRPARRRVLAAQTAKAGSGTGPARCSLVGSAPPAPKPPRELVEFEAMKRLEDLKRVAVMNPTDANLIGLHALPAHGDEQVRSTSPNAGSAWCDRARSRLRPERTADQRGGDQRLRRAAARAVRRRPSRAWPPPTGSSSCSAATARIATASRRS